MDASSKPARTVVCLISGETLPNVLFIREFPAERYVFISTRRMEGERRSLWVARAAGIPEGAVKPIIVNQDDLWDILEALNAAGLQPDSSWYVNITGGNKLMSIGAFDYFARFNAHVFYLAVDNQHFQELMPTQALHPIRTRLTLAQYFEAYGMRYEGESSVLPKYAKQAAKLMEECRAHKGRADLVSAILPNVTHHLSDWQDRVFYSGQWFEMYVFMQVCQALGLSPDSGQVAFNVKLFAHDKGVSLANENEIDVAFVRDNYLYVMECKVSVSASMALKEKAGGKSSNVKMHDWLYKLAAIKQNMGLNARPLLLMPNHLRSSPHRFAGLERRCRILRIPAPVEYETLATDERFQDFLRKWRQ